MGGEPSAWVCWDFADVRAGLISGWLTKFQVVSYILSAPDEALLPPDAFASPSSVPGQWSLLRCVGLRTGSAALRLVCLVYQFISVCAVASLVLRAKWLKEHQLDGTSVSAASMLLSAATVFEAISDMHCYAEEVCVILVVRVALHCL